MCLAHSTYSVQMKSTTHAASTINPSITKNMEDLLAKEHALTVTEGATTLCFT